jgi:hypothetical protein
MGNGVDAGIAAFNPQGADASTVQSWQQAPQVATGMATMSAAAAPQPQVPQTPRPDLAPGSFGWKLARVLGGTMSALSSLSGPAVAAPPKAPAGAGALFGAQSAAAEMQKENIARDVQRREQARLDENQQIETQKAKAYIAHENISTYQDQMLVWQKGDEMVDKSSESGNMLMKAYTEPPSGVKGAEKFMANVDGADIQTALQKANQDQFKRSGKYLDPTQQHIFPTGSKSVTVGYDPQGQPVLRKRQLYTVVEDMPEVQLDAAQAAYISKFTDQKAMEGQKLPGYLYGTLAQQAKSAETAQVAVDDMRAQLGLRAIGTEDKLKMIKNYPSIGKALAQGGGDPFKTMATLEQTQAGLGQAFIGFAFGDEKDPSGYLNAMKLEAEFRKAAFDAWAKTLNLQQKLPWGNPNLADDPKAFYNSLSKEQRIEADSLYDGTSGIEKMSYFLTRRLQGDTDVFTAVKAAHPDFDATKIENFVPLVKSYQTVENGKPGFALNAMDHTMQLLHQFYDDTSASQFKPGSAAAGRRNLTLAMVAGEIDKSVNASSTDAGRKPIVDALTPNSPFSRLPAVKQAAVNVMKKYEDYKSDFIANAPSAKWANQVPTPFTEDGLKSFVYMVNDGKLPITPVETPAGIVGPGLDGKGVAVPGGTVDQVMPKRSPKDGKLHWVWSPDGGRHVKDLGLADANTQPGQSIQQLGY